MKKQHQAQSVVSPPTMEFFTLAGLAASAALGVNVGEKAVRGLRSPEPVVVQILDSTFDQQHHRISLKVTNQTLHGIYIERTELEAPTGKSYTLHKVEFKNMSLDSAPVSKPSPWAPVLIPPGNTISFTLEIDLCDKAKTKPYGTLKLQVSRLEEKKESPVEAHFRLRWL
ncbi:MAG: hypothetical protein LAO78_11260 [Acidobacteriia bacterium]|nr:hypothetical protein [Terriglobia bacterium]